MENTNSVRISQAIIDIAVFLSIIVFKTNILKCKHTYFSQSPIVPLKTPKPTNILKVRSIQHGCHGKTASRVVSCEAKSFLSVFSVSRHSEFPVTSIEIARIPFTVPSPSPIQSRTISLHSSSKTTPESDNRRYKATVFVKKQGRIIHAEYKMIRKKASRQANLRQPKRSKIAVQGHAPKQPKSIPGLMGYAE